MKLKKIVAPVKLWKRVLAYLIDEVIIGFVIVMPFGSFFANFDNDLFVNEFSSEIFLVGLIISILSVLYWSISEYLANQSIGKALVGIYVRSTNNELMFWQCLVRSLTKFSGLLLFIDSLRIIFKGDYQRYFEKLSKTEVVDGEI